MNRLALVLILCAGGATVVPAESVACGASLFGVGQSMRFRSYRAPRPATVLVYYDQTLKARTGGDVAQFEKSLERAGHSVTVVESHGDYDRALAGTSYDVLIADIDSVQPLVAAQSSSSAGKPSLLPIAFDDDSFARATREGYSSVLGEKSDLRQALRAINDLMKLRLK